MILVLSAALLLSMCQASIKKLKLVSSNISHTLLSARNPLKYNLRFEPAWLLDLF